MAYQLLITCCTCTFISLIAEYIIIAVLIRQIRLVYYSSDKCLWIQGSADHVVRYRKDLVNNEIYFKKFQINSTYPGGAPGVPGYAPLAFIQVSGIRNLQKTTDFFVHFVTEWPMRTRVSIYVVNLGIALDNNEIYFKKFQKNSTYPGGAPGVPGYALLAFIRVFV